MSRLVNAVVIGIAVFILVAGSFWYLSVGRGQEKLAVDSDLSLESANSNRTRMVADLTFHNRHDVDVKLTEFSYEFRAGSMMLASNHTSEGFPMKPRTEREESIILDFPTDFVSQWLKNHVQGGEKTTVVFEGNATFQVGSQNQSVEFSEERPFSTEIRTSLEEAGNCPRPAPEPCVESISGTWRERNETLVLDLSMQVKNGVQEEVKISNPKATLRWGDVDVADAEAGGTVLEGDGSERLDFPLFMKHDELKTWWPDHLESCEKSTITLGVTFTYQVQPENRTTTTPTPTTISTPPNFTVTPTTSSSTSPTTSSTTTTSSTAAPPPSTTSTSPSASPTTSPSTSPSGSTSPTGSAEPSPTGDAEQRVSYLFLVAEPEPENRTATWSLEGSEFRSTFACDDPDELLDLP